MVKHLRTSAKKRVKRRLKSYKRAYRDGKIELDAISRSVASYKGHLAYGHTHKLTKRLLGQFVLSKRKPEQETKKGEEEE